MLSFTTPTSLASAVVLFSLWNLVLVLLFSFTVVVSYVTAYRRTRHLPQPKQVPLLGHLLDVFKYGAGDPAKLCTIYVKQGFRRFLLQLGPVTYFFTIDPKDIQEAARKQAKNFPHRGHTNQSAFVIGSYGREAFGYGNLAHSQDNSWKSVRAAVANIFTESSLDKHLPYIHNTSVKVANAISNSSEGGQEVEVYSLLSKFAQTNMLQLSFGLEVDTLSTTANNGSSLQAGNIDDKAAKLSQAIQNIFTAPVFDYPTSLIITLLPPVLQPYLSVLPFQLAALLGGRERKLRDGRRYMYNVALALINTVRKDLDQPIKYPVCDKYLMGAPSPGSILHALATAKSSETKQPFDDGAIAGNVGFFLQAGQDTTAATLAMTLHLLAKNPAAQEVAAKECQALQLEKVTGLDDLKKCLPYTYACFNETMRLHPSVPINNRIAVRDLYIDKYFIPKGTMLGFNIIGMHRDPRLYKDPDVFRPERFLPGNPENDSRPEGAFLPFGAGPRNCLGQRFALLGALTCLASMLRSMKLELSAARQNKDVELTWSIFHVPLNGIWLKTSPR